LDVSKALVEAGAKVDLPNVDYHGKAGKTAVEYAQDGGYIDLAEFLRENGEQGVTTKP
jgi:ankyrin repeat protein